MAGIIGIGVDVVDVERFRKQTEKQPALLPRLLSETEIAEAGSRFFSMAGKFAAKEAFIKAAGGIEDFSFQDVQITSRGDRPFFRFTGGCAELISNLNAKAHLSISHDDGIAIAYVLLERLGDNGDAKHEHASGSGGLGGAK